MWRGRHTEADDRDAQMEEFAPEARGRTGARRPTSTHVTSSSLNSRTLSSSRSRSQIDLYSSADTRDNVWMYARWLELRRILALLDDELLHAHAARPEYLVQRVKAERAALDEQRQLPALLHRNEAPLKQLDAQG